MQSGGKDYFGMLHEIIELEYNHEHKVVPFKCKWFDVFNENVGIQIEVNGVTSVNIRCFLKTNKSYVLASQVEQVYYVKDHMHEDWQVMIKTNPRNFYDILDEDEDDAKSSLDNCWAATEAYIPVVSNDRASLIRDDIEPEVVDSNIVTQELSRHNKRGKRQRIDDGDNVEDSGEEDMPLFGDEVDEE